MAQLPNVEARFGWRAETIEQDDERRAPHDRRGRRQRPRDARSRLCRRLRRRPFASCASRSASSAAAPISISSWCWRCSARASCTRSSSAFRRARPIACCTPISKATGNSSAVSTSARAGSSTRRCPPTPRATITISTACCRKSPASRSPANSIMSASGICASRSPRHYQVGRVFIAGDAAHSHPPYGGYGLNNGLDDVVNLGWKLAAKLKGWGSDALLQTYSEERHPIFKETARRFHRGRHRRDREFLRRYSPERDRANSSAPGRSMPSQRAAGADL